MTKDGDTGRKTPAKVLIVDDEPSSLELLEVYLSEKGYEICCAVDGAECLRKVADFKPQVLVLDVRLPDADGLDILKELKGRRNAPHVIIITALQQVLARAAIQHIVARTAIETGTPTRDVVVAVAAVQLVIAGAADQRVAARSVGDVSWPCAWRPRSSSWRD